MLFFFLFSSFSVSSSSCSFFYYFYGASLLFRTMAYPVFFLQVSVLLKAAFQFPIRRSKCTAFFLAASSHSSFIVSHRYSFFSAKHPPITYWGIRESSSLLRYNPSVVYSGVKTLVAPHQYRVFRSPHSQIFF